MHCTSTAMNVVLMLTPVLNYVSTSFLRLPKKWESITELMMRPAHLHGTYMDEGKKASKFYHGFRYMCLQQSQVSKTIVLQTQKMLKEKVGKI